MKKTLNLEQRLFILNEMLHRPQGVNRYEYEEKLSQDVDFEDDFDFYEDIRKAKKLLKQVSGNTTIEVIKEGKGKRFKLGDNDPNLCELLTKERNYRTNGDILDFIHYSQGIPPVWREKLIKREEENENTEKRVILSFEPTFDDLDFDDDANSEWNGIPNKLSKLYHAALYYHAVHIEVKNFKNKSFNAILHPEFLKQYHRNWYVFGLIQEDENQEPTFDRIPIHCISNNLKHDTKIKFKASGTDYAEYFEDIIGVDNIENRDPERITLALKNSAIYRILAGELGAKNLIEDKKIQLEGLDGYKPYYLSIKWNRELERIILRHGSDIIVIAPGKRVATIKAELKKALNLYK